MAYERQKQLQLELNERIPRGPRGGRQNQFRFGFAFYRQQGFSFDVSASKALECARTQDPTFEPRIMPAGLEDTVLSLQPVTATLTGR